MFKSFLQNVQISTAKIKRFIVTASISFDIFAYFRTFLDRQRRHGRHGVTKKSGMAGPSRLGHSLRIQMNQIVRPGRGGFSTEARQSTSIYVLCARVIMENPLMQRFEERCAHGAAYLDEQFGIHVDHGKQRLDGLHIAVSILRQPFPVVAARLQARLQETPRVEIFVPVAIHRISFR